MSSESVEPVRKRLNLVIDAFNARGVEAALHYFDPNLVWNAPPEWLEKPTYRGHEGLRELARSWGQAFDEYQLDLDRVVGLGGGRAVALIHQRGRLRGAGHPVDMPVGWIVELVDDQLIRVDVFFSWEAALEAAGLPA